MGTNCMLGRKSLKPAGKRWRLKLALLDELNNVQTGFTIHLGKPTTKFKVMSRRVKLERDTPRGTVGVLTYQVSIVKRFRVVK